MKTKNTTLKSKHNRENGLYKSRYQLSPFNVSNLGIRHILTHRDTGLPMHAASIYEAHLAQKTDSHNTRSKEMFYFSSLYTWSEENHVDLDQLLLRGEGLTLPQARSFAAWIKSVKTQTNGVIPQEKRRSINALFGACSVICTWFIQQYTNVPTHDARRVIEIELLLESQRRIWKEVRIKVRNEVMAPDLTDNQIAIIEHFLKPTNRSKIVGEAIATRDYLIWRMVIEFGMRKGEILAMRTCDCPTRESPYFKIVRIEERGTNYLDPRRNPPRPKTLSRDLGFILENTVFPKLISEYVSTHRFRVAKRNGKKVKQFILPHNFLIVTESGEPLSIRAADDVAKAIKTGTGIEFHWHLARHAFFNRAYAGVARFKDQREYDVKLADLVHWGGWESEQSLEIYTKRARAERARNALCIWQKGGDEWMALT